MAKSKSGAMVYKSPVQYMTFDNMFEGEDEKQKLKFKDVILVLDKEETEKKKEERDALVQECKNIKVPKGAGEWKKRAFKTIPQNLEVIPNGLQIYLKDCDTGELFTTTAIVNSYIFRDDKDEFEENDVIKINHVSGNKLYYKVKKKSLKELIKQSKKRKQNIFDNL